MNKKSIKYKNPGSSSITRFERIHTEIFDDRKNAEFLIAKEIKKLIEKNNKKNKTTVLGLATGSSPLGVYKSLIDGVTEAIKTNKEIVKLCEVKNSNIYITVEKPEWKDSLDSALQYYVNTEEYEKCSKIKDLIDKL